MSRLRALTSRLTYGNVVASLALFVALGGTSYAIASNSVGTKQLKRNAVTSSKVRNGTLRARDIHKASLGADRLTAAARASLTGQTGPKGATGLTGAKGATGAAGPSNTYASATEAGVSISALPGTIAREVTVPAGDYVVSATAALDNGQAQANAPYCSLTGPNGSIKGTYETLKLAANLAQGEAGIYSTTVGTTFAVAGAIQLRCDTSPDNANVQISTRSLVAVKVGALTTTP